VDEKIQEANSEMDKKMSEADKFLDSKREDVVQAVTEAGQKANEASASAQNSLLGKAKGFLKCKQNKFRWFRSLILIVLFFCSLNKRPTNYTPRKGKFLQSYFSIR